MAMDPVIFRNLLTQSKDTFNIMQFKGDAILLNEINQTNIENTNEVKELIQLWETYELFYDSHIELVQEILPMENLTPTQSRELDAYCNEVMDQCAILRERMQPFVNRFLDNCETTFGPIFNSDNSYHFFQPDNFDVFKSPVEKNTSQNSFN